MFQINNSWRRPQSASVPVLIPASISLFVPVLSLTYFWFFHFFAYSFPLLMRCLFFFLFAVWYTSLWGFLSALCCMACIITCNLPFFSSPAYFSYVCCTHIIFCLPFFTSIFRFFDWNLTASLGLFKAWLQIMAEDWKLWPKVRRRRRLRHRPGHKGTKKACRRALQTFIWSHFVLIYEYFFSFQLIFYPGEWQLIPLQCAYIHIHMYIFKSIFVTYRVGGSHYGLNGHLYWPKPIFKSR